MEQLVAPIALHPDPLLSQMLMASTYPTEVVQAARWVKAHPKTTGQALQDAMAKEPWDPSVKALTAVPQVLQMMSDKLDWTQQLGDAFLAQQDDLMAAVQRLRQRAENAGNLKSNDKQTVRKSSAPRGGGGSTGGGTVIEIAPANPEYLYVPVYDPRVCYGDWPYATYEPFYWYPVGYVGTGILSFAAAVAIGSAIWGHFDWWNKRVDIDINRYNKFNRANITDKSWRHDARHRGNVPYRDAHVAQRFGDTRRDAARDNYRGKAEAGRRDLAKSDKGGNMKNRADTRPGDRQKSAAKGGDRQRAHSGQSAKSKQAKNKSAARTKQAARSKTASRQRTASHRSRGGGHARVQHTRTHAYRAVRGGGHRMSMRGGGRHIGRGGGGRRGGRR